MNYLALVNMLSVQITPEIRRLVLERLTAMNNELLGVTIRGHMSDTNSHSSRTQPMITRDTASSNTIKKDAKEMVHPAFVHQSYAPNYQSYHAPVSAPSEFSKGLSRRSISITLSPPDSPEINLDDILDEGPSQPDSLDIRLAGIKKLHDKILADKHRRRRERAK